MRGTFFVLLLLLSACASTDQQYVQSARAVPIDKPVSAGIGDVVLDLKIIEPLPNAFGKADIFGRTRDAGRVTVRYLGSKENVAYFSREDVSIQSSDTTMSRTPTYLPTVQQTTTTGNVGMIPVSATSTTTGGTFIPARPSTNFVTGRNQLLLSAPVGGTLQVSGKTLSVLGVDDNSIQFSVH